ncbi:MULTISPECIES: hypothetical protein [Okeania]|uniref:hypothetical protein n=1 Tax=Okeania TaxID=1458928 RepID=UPI000F5276EF|nr:MULTISPECIES: hypothetical protein [Okeania]NEP40050.1 hypothetical protein [Okeania sp. SIO2H7]NET13272.1 hypothetical protein [Okeania sp. SIO1H6]NEP71951.1 hypothetical protein [Okeania sp. SIO2G5]NEP93004.1 hypothetical protein [Okeania sp. SIO2F5]NEQ90672.1 hypothetical protein [Okeania sp. SIO2G4]
MSHGVVREIEAIGEKGGKIFPYSSIKSLGRWGVWGYGDMGIWRPTPNPYQDGNIEKDLAMALRWKISLYRIKRI